MTLNMYTKRIAQVVMFLLCCLLQTGCYKKVIDTPIHKSPFIVDQKGITFQCSPTLKRRCNTAGVRIAIVGDWTSEPPWTAIEFSNGKRVKLKVRLTAVDNDIYESTILGRAGGMLDVRFDPPVPKNVGIKQVQITADASVECTEVIWHDFHAK